MTTDKPVWLLDVDGVLSAPRHRWPCRINRTGVKAGGEYYRLTWAPALLDRIRDLAAAGTVDIIWATSWCPHATLLEGVFGLPPLQRAWDEELTGTTLSRAKALAVTEVRRMRRRFIWTDDEDAYDYRDAGQYSIRPDPRRGLEPVHLDAIEDFIAHHQQD